MQIILLSGGSGKRLWPLSNDVRSKQFLKLMTDETGNKQSIIQRVYSQIRQAQPQADITAATNAAQLDSIHNQLGGDISVVIEPQRKDTFPAIMLSCVYLALEKHAGLDETVVVLPVDTFTELSFFSVLTRLDKLISENAADIALIGIKPLLPTSKYGYIVPEAEISPGVYAVSRFVEKPPEPEAEILINEGAYWNGGVFAFKLGYIINIAKANASFESFQDLRGMYGSLEKISFDCKVVEKADRAAFVPYLGKWTDIGTWRTLTDEMPQSALGDVTLDGTKNTFAINELKIPLVAVGTKNLIIAASPDGILVSDVIESSRLKPVVDKLEQTRPMYEERRWGEYTVLLRNNNCLIKQLFLTEGKSVGYKSHKYRDEIWVVTSGTGTLVLDGQTRTVNSGDFVKIMRGQKHRLTADSDLYIAEVQLGDVFDENDIERFGEDYV